MERFEDPQCKKEIEEEYNEDELVDGYMNNKREKLWYKALYNKADQDKKLDEYVTGISAHLYTELQAMMRREYEQHYGLEQQKLTGYLECMKDLNNLPSEDNRSKVDSSTNSNGFPLDAQSTHSREIEHGSRARKSREEELQSQIQELQRVIG